MDSSPVNVFILNPWFSDRITGPSERFRRYAPGLRERGIHLHAIAGLENNRPPFETINGIPVYRFPISFEHKYISYQVLQSALRSFHHKGEWPHVVQLLGHSMRNAPLIWRTQLLRRVPFLWVSTMMKTPAKEGIGVLGRLKRTVYLQLLFRPLNCIVTSSQVMEENLISLGAPPNRVEVIPNGVDLLRFHPVSSQADRDTLRRQLGIEPTDEVLLFVGFISFRKGIDVLLAAWQQITKQRPKTRLLLVGHRIDANNTDVPPSFHDQTFMDQIDALVRQSAHPDRIVFCGNVTNVEQYMRAADVFLFPSRHEGMPNVIPEAMASGLPCLISPFKSLPKEFGKPGQEYLLVEREAAALARATKDILRNQPAREVMGRSARMWVEKHMDVEHSLDRFALLYRELSNSNHNWNQTR